MQNETIDEEIKSGVSKKKSEFNIFKKLKGKDRYETMENYSIAGVIFGSLALSAGIGLTAINPKGISAITAMMGALLSFICSVTLVFSWLLKELFGE